LADAGSGGITGSQVAEALGTSKTTALEHLSALRAAGVAELTGGGRGSRFVIARTDHRRAVADLRARMARITKDAGTADGYLDEGHVWQQA
jgi:predicted ArsR family transcriptional regulator